MSAQTVPVSDQGEKVIFITSGSSLAELIGWLPAAAVADDITSVNLERFGVVISDSPAVFTPALKVAVDADRARLVYVLGTDGTLPAAASGFPIYFFLARPFHRAVTDSTVAAALDALRLSRAARDLTTSLRRAHEEIDDLNNIGISLSSERDVQSLLDLILRTSREITSSDAGALYLVEENEETNEKVLRFTLTQNDSIAVPFNQFTIPIDASRISSYVALTGQTVSLADAYHLPSGVPYGFSRDFDAQIGYRTKSILAVAMKNAKGEVVGVLQLINCKKDIKAKVNPETADEVVQPYQARVQQLVESLASQAAVALENARLYESIQKLFEGFVQASVVAIEARDPTTFGHSFRVEKLTLALAEAVDRADDGPYKDITFTREQFKEIRYAAVLHDFGKVGVREEVLVKAKKLYPNQLDAVRERFNYVRKAVLEQHSKKKLDYLLEKGREEFLAKLPEFDSEIKARMEEMDDFWKFVLQCNEPTVLPEGNFERLKEMAAMTYLDDWSNDQKALLQPYEVRLLSIPKGSLDPSERLEIESHVIHTFNFLTKIPWTKDIRGVPLIARGHHEKLDGSGYPFRVNGQEIPIQTRMMTISDIYDALSASDRPYKRAVPPDRALGIIESEVKANLLDGELFRVFRAKELWRLTVK